MSLEREHQAYHRWKAGEGYKMGVTERWLAIKFAQTLSDVDTIVEIEEDESQFEGRRRR